MIQSDNYFATLYIIAINYTELWSYTKIGLMFHGVYIHTVIVLVCIVKLINKQVTKRICTKYYIDVKTITRYVQL